MINSKIKDSFKILDKAKTNIKNLSSQINKALNKALPNRILSRSNIFNTAINVSRDLTTMALLQLEDNLVENNILVAQKETSVRGLATLTGHDPTRAISSKGVVRVNLSKNISTVSGPSITFNGTTLVSSTNGLKYSLLGGLKKVFVNNTESIFLNIVEGEFKNREYIAEGLSLEKVELEDEMAIENGNITVTVNGVPYSKKDSLYDMPQNENTFLVKNGIGNQVDIVFGNNVFGNPLKEGDVVEIKYLVTNGEDGNILENGGFTFEENVFGSDGSSISINDFVEIEIESGFQLGSNGENIETTRLISGMNSRALVFMRPENLKSHLSKLSILSYVDVWSEPGDNIFKLLLLPNVKNKLNVYSDYFNLGIEDMKLTNAQKNSIMEYINSPGSQVTNTEYQFAEPIFEKYCIFFYISGEIPNKKQTKNEIYELISEFFLKNTFLSNVIFKEKIISRSNILNTLTKNIDEIDEVNVSILSEKNETAKINGFYYKNENVTVGSVKKNKKVKKNLSENENPNLGFNELGSIQTEDKNSIPILSSDFNKYNEGSEFKLEHPLYIFHKREDGSYEKL